MQEGRRVSWKAVNGIRSGIIIGRVTRKMGSEFLGYLVELDNKKRVIVHPESIINGSQTAQ